MPLDAFNRLSTGIKMLVILSAALLPLGLIAIFASVEAARTNRLTREAEIRLIAGERARQLTEVIMTEAATLRAALSDPSRVDASICREVAASAAGRGHALGIGVTSSAGRWLCATPGLARRMAADPVGGVGVQATLLEESSVLRFTVADLPGRRLAVGEMTQATLAAILRERRPADTFGIRLRQGDASVRVANVIPSSRPLGGTTTVSVPVAGGQLQLLFTSPATPMRAIELLMTALPILMFLAATLTGWLVIDRLVIRPLARLQRSVTRYGEAGGDLVLPVLSTPSTEIRSLAASFAAVTRSLTEHEMELEQALARQTKLTREVHHRVKNNLQVVSSLINLQARGAPGREVADAYASIQRRVDALAVVHRNLYAEVEDNRGVALRPLLGELAGNLKATAPPEASAMRITLDVPPAYVTQDIAVPVAFLATELIELAMACCPEDVMAIRVEPTDDPARAIFSITASGLVDEACREHPSANRVLRVVEGLSRQLRARLEQDGTTGRHAIVIPVLPAAPLAAGG